MNQPKSEVPGAEELSLILNSLDDWKAEFGTAIQSILSDEDWCNHIQPFWQMRERTGIILGDLIYYRLRSQFGNQESNLEEKHNKGARKAFAYWVELITGSKDQNTYQSLYRMWRAAQTRALVPDTANRSLTAQAEMGMNAGDTEDEQRENITRRNGAMDSLDPSGERDTTTAREVKAGERGITDKDLWQPALRQTIDTEKGTDALIMAQFGTRVTDAETGETSIEFDWMPLARIDFVEPKSEENREQHTAYKKMIYRRVDAAFVGSMEQ